MPSTLSHVELARRVGKASKNTVNATLLQSQEALGVALVRLESEIDEKLKCKASVLAVKAIEVQVAEIAETLKAEITETQTAYNTSTDAMVAHLLQHNERINNAQKHLNELVVLVRKIQAEKLQPPNPTPIPEELAALPGRFDKLEGSIGNYLMLGMLLSVILSMAMPWFLPTLNGRNQTAPAQAPAAPVAAPVAAPAPVQQPPAKPTAKPAAKPALKKVKS